MCNNHEMAWENSKIITTNPRYHQRRCLNVSHVNSDHAPLNRDDGGLLPEAYLHLNCIGLGYKFGSYFHNDSVT